MNDKPTAENKKEQPKQPTDHEERLELSIVYLYGLKHGAKAQRMVNRAVRKLETGVV